MYRVFGRLHWSQRDVDDAYVWVLGAVVQELDEEQQAPGAPPKPGASPHRDVSHLQARMAGVDQLPGWGEHSTLTPAALGAALGG